MASSSSPWGYRSFANGNPLNGVVIGSSGSGKSMLTGRTVIETSHGYSNTFFIDFGESALPTAKALGAKTLVRLSANSNTTINPMDTKRQPLSQRLIADASATIQLAAGIDGDADHEESAIITNTVRNACTDASQAWLEQESGRRIEVTRDWLTYQRWRETNVSPGEHCFEVYRATRSQDPALHLPSESDLRDALWNPENREAILRHACSFMKRGDHATLRQVHDLLFVEARGSGSAAELKLHLALRLQPWLRDSGKYGPIIDGPSTIDLDVPVAHIELGFIPEALPQLRRLASFLIVNTIKQIILTKPRGQRKRMILEELPSLLQFPGAESFVSELYRQLRKYSCQVIATTQQWSAIESVSVRNAILGNSKALFLLKGSDRSDLEQIVNAAGLPTSLVETVMAFPEPTKDQGAYFAYARLDKIRPEVIIGRNRVRDDLYRVLTSTGEERQAIEEASIKGTEVS